ncbi:MAG: NlpC/P60 family protein, partial [Bacteroidales bacterium]|nr:NlpC/P60 family protein [Bacteroidales bacterium]
MIQLAGCQKKEVPAELQEQLDSIAAVMVPQHGEALCDISMVMSDSKSITVKGETNLPEARDAVIALLNRSGYSFTDSITLLPDPAVVDKPWGLVSVSVCNIRTKPSHADEMATQALMGTPVKILNKRGGWLFIQTPDSYLGWTDDPVTELSDSALTAWKSADRLIYTRHTGVITDAEGQTVSDIVFGVILEKRGEQRDNFMVRLPDGRVGFIKKGDADDFRVWAEKTKPDADRMIKFARTFLGTPYLWGGTSTKAIDCSGFTKTIYYSAGLILTRDASGQFRYGEVRNVENGCDSLVPGDLLFFGRVRDGKKRITHTGMYIGDTE